MAPNTLPVNGHTPNPVDLTLLCLLLLPFDPSPPPFFIFHQTSKKRLGALCVCVCVSPSAPHERLSVNLFLPLPCVLVLPFLHRLANGVKVFWCEKRRRREQE